MEGVIGTASLTTVIQQHREVAVRQGRHSDLVVKSKPEVDSLSDIYRQQVGNRRLILVSNRGPVEHLITSSGAIRAQRGSGGVVTALAALGEHVDLTWIAAAMTDGDRQVANGAEATATTPLPAGLQVRLLPLPERIYHRYYNVFSNQILWFLQHYMLDSIYGPGMNESSRRAWENGYVLANRAFAEALQKGM
ncbi:MAG: trehalose-6-phosphate synthase [Chloroflexi bacterium]|nr:trehalose-6-phosphate synthase [Chloroflexota bacterium]